MMRHPPANNQRTVALFFANGHYDALVRRLHQSYYERWQAMERALHAYLPKTFETPTYGGTSFWIRGPEGLDGQALAAQALERGIVLEPGDICFAGATPPLNHFRLRSEEHTSELQSLMRISYAVFCLKKKKHEQDEHSQYNHNNT